VVVRDPVVLKIIASQETISVRNISFGSLLPHPSVLWTPSLSFLRAERRGKDYLAKVVVFALGTIQDGRNEV
jgi:hypothetical protein